MPLTIGLLILLAATALPAPHRLGAARLWATAAISALVAAGGLWAGLSGLF